MVDDQSRDSRTLLDARLDAPGLAALGDRLARRLRAGDTVLLQGGLGAGKTHFARALIQAMTGPGTEVPSPTYTLVQTYPLADTTLWHFDLYRLEDPRELAELGLEPAFGEIALIEWPERLGTDRPARRLELHLSPEGEAARRVRLIAHGDWGDRLDDL